ncbi:MFS transporter [Streptomyces pactum]|uniref:MFS transporter n=1 Tax=Streptomyces pactum TaxID=68249 RepID=UPI0036F74428
MRRPTSPTALRDRIPGGPDGRRMLAVTLVDRIGSGLWAATAVLYFTYVARLGTAEIGLMLAVSGAIGIAGPPLAGHLADRLPLRPLLVTVQAVRAVASLALLTTTDLTLLTAVTAVGSLGDRASSVLTKLYATRVAGPARARYQAVNRTVANLGWAVGGLAAAGALAAGTTAVYRFLLLGDGLSFVLAALLTLRCQEPPPASRVVAAGRPAATDTPPAATDTPRAEAKAPDAGEGAPDAAGRASGAPGAAADAPAGAAGASGRRPGGRGTPAAGPGTAPAARANPWRDRPYLAYTAGDAVLFLDDSVFKVGLPLWTVTATSAPHGLAPLLMVLNNVLVVLLQVPCARFGATPRAARRALLPLGGVFLAGALALAASATGPSWAACTALVLAATAFTLAEILHATISWELSVALAPAEAQGAYLGVHSLAQAVQRSAGPLAVTTAIAVGPAGWAALGGLLAATCLAQRRLVRDHTEPVMSVPPVTVSEHRSTAH